jgi:hypothetical protein
MQSEAGGEAGSGSGSGSDDSTGLDLAFHFLDAESSQYDTLLVEYVTDSGERQVVNTSELFAGNVSVVDTYVTIPVPSKEVYISYTVGEPAHDWYMFVSWQHGSLNLPTMSPTPAKDSEPTEAPTPGDAVPTGAPTANGPMRSHAKGQVRLTGYLTYEEVSNKTSKKYREFVNMFESDVENFERTIARETHCIIDNLSNGSIIVEFSLTVMLGSPTAASEGLLEMQRAIDSGTLTRLAGSPLDPSFAVAREDWIDRGECQVCPECAPLSTGTPSTAPTTAPTLPLVECFSSDEISGNGVMVGFFIGIAILLGTGFLVYLGYWGYQEWIVKDLDGRVELPQSKF